MKSPIPIILLPTIALTSILPHRTTAYHALGPDITVTVQSNQTLSRIDEFNHTNIRIRNRHKRHADKANTTVDELIASGLALQFDVCFPQQYCTIVEDHPNLFKERFRTHVCQEYCNEQKYHASVEVLDVCDVVGVSGPSSSSSSGNKCIDFGLTIQASSRVEAEDIKRELGGYIVSSRSVWRNVLDELAPQSSPDNVDDPDVLGYYISENVNNETWYPAWDRGDELCSNDANVPFYMKLNPDEYLASSMTDCCRKHYWWNVRGCADPQSRSCPEGWEPSPEQNARGGVVNGENYGSYPNIFYPGCKPIIVTTRGNNRHLEQISRREQEEAAYQRELRHRVQEHKLKSLLERQARLQKLMHPSSHRPPADTGWKARRMR